MFILYFMMTKKLSFNVQKQNLVLKKTLIVETSKDFGINTKNIIN